MNTIIVHTNQVKVGDRIGAWRVADGPTGPFWVSDVASFPVNGSKIVFEDFTRRIEINAKEKVQNIKKDPVIELYRYVRPLNNDLEIDNLKGITFYIRLNYDLGTFIYSSSVCNGDNFDKAYGRTLAYANRTKNSYTGKMKLNLSGKYQVSEEGILQDIYNDLKQRNVNDIVVRQMEEAGFMLEDQNDFPVATW